MPLGCPNHLQPVEHIAWLSKLSRMYWQYGNMGKTKDSRKHPVSVVLWKSARHVWGEQPPSVKFTVHINTMIWWKWGFSIAVYFAGNCELLSQCYPEKLPMPPVQKMQTYEEVDSVWGSRFLRHARDWFLILGLWICPPKITCHSWSMATL